MTIQVGEPNGSDHEQRLQVLGLSSPVIHDGLRRGVSRANNRTARALHSSAGTDIYHDAMEDLHRILAADGWYLDDVDGQPRLFHPDGLICFTVSSGIKVGQKRMRTRKKGPATKGSLTLPEFVPGLLPEVDAELLAKRAARSKRVPFYLLVIERVIVGRPGVVIELAEPAGMTEGQSVTTWGERVKVQFFDLDGDLSAFENPDSDGGDEFDVPVVPR